MLLLDHPRLGGFMDAYFTPGDHILLPSLPLLCLLWCPALRCMDAYFTPGEPIVVTIV
jgi:hypothetical protein